MVGRPVMSMCALGVDFVESLGAVRMGIGGTADGARWLGGQVVLLGVERRG